MNDSVSAQRADDATLPLALVLASADGDRQRLARAARDVVRIEFCDRVSDAQARLAQGATALFLARLRDEAGVRIDGAVRELRAASPHLPIVIVASSNAAARRDGPALAQIGATRVVRDRIDDLREALRDVLTRERCRVRRIEAAERCAHWAPDAARDTIQQVIARGHRPLAVRELADALGVPRKTLDRRLSRGSPLTARQAIGWGRLVAIAIDLDESSATVADVASELQFSSVTALRNLLQRYMGLTPTQLRALGGLDEVLARLRTILGSPVRG